MTALVVIIVGASYRQNDGTTALLELSANGFMNPSFHNKAKMSISRRKNMVKKNDSTENYVYWACALLQHV